MIQNNRFSKASGPKKTVQAAAQTRPAGKGHNHPVSVDAFDYEHMGIASKE